MTTTMGVLAGLALAGGFLAISTGLRKIPVDAAAPTPTHPTRTRARLHHRLTRRELITAAAAATAGLVTAALTGWIVAIPLLPAAALGLPRILHAGREDHTITHLEALAEWTRSLAGVLATNQGLTDALTSTLRSAPTAVRPQVERLVARLQARLPAEEALRAFGDDLDDPTADLITATLILGSRTTGAGLTRILTTLASTVSDEVEIRRKIEAERSTPRSQARVTTLISAVVLTLFVAFTQFGQAYHDLGGQLVLTMLLIAYGACLFWMHTIAKTKPPPRFLVQGPQFANTDGRQGSEVRS